ncbi:Kinesin-like motor protein-like protein [Emericellopsis cladophorae]|uniref:Kinesin-like motor protein-like protein n=1 Tax=Emericellopsis cladophorae TaxID=2686198 RepID=A0A9P9XX15_9HYPO|nr:Kinesin-like motor protein-like protein [Emericellopsis cladophorae]KAI6779213.1 Kinesin-like motor protein-like protein [Emericellopsis cladophorae]
MESRTSHNLFEVYLRLRPSPPGAPASERILTVEAPETKEEEVQREATGVTHITLNPPTDRRRAIEKFAFTRVFEPDAGQLDVFHSAGVVPMVEGVLARDGGDGTDAMIATLGVTGSGKTHTMLGSKTQRGLTQLTLDVLFRSIGLNMLEGLHLASAADSLQASDPSEATLMTASNFIDAVCGDVPGSRSRAATPMIGESHNPLSPGPARRNIQRPSALPQTPDVSNIDMCCDASAEYAVVVSMYEVHNDRIYDLLSPPSRNASSKDIRRRPLLFKSTEIERARDAKTAGATLVEAGKINESLMYLGQCLQTQSEVGTSSKPNIVPYRQCKLTELLFSNSFPSSSSSSQPQGPRRNPQRGVMIVTADPLGDFNATSQILRYSALAREVTVPRIPSITATILANAPPMAGRPPSPVQTHHPRPFMPPGSSGSYRVASSDERATMELAALEIARLSDDIDHLREEVDAQTEARMTAEAHLMSMEDRMLDLEASIRDDCATEFEERLAIELARFKSSLLLEQERNDEHWDRKVDVLERGLGTDEADDKENVLVESLEEELERLRRENVILKRELANRSPSKRRPLEERGDCASSPQGLPTKGEGVAQLGRKMEKMHLSNSNSRAPGGASSGSPKKLRRLGNRKWEHEEDADLEY